MRRSIKALALLLAVALLASLALTGCGGTEDTTDTTDGTTANYTLVQEGTLIVGSDTAFPPFESMAGSTAEGFDVDLAAAIAEEMGLTSEFKTYKFDALIPALKAGNEFDVIMSAMTITDDRKKEISFSDPYIDSNQSIAVKNDSAITGQADLAGKIIGVQSGTTGEAWTQENIKDASKIVPFDDVMAAFGALQAGQVDAVVNDLPVSAFVVKDEARGLKIVEEVNTGEQYGIGVSQDNPELLTAINDALAKVRESGKYDEIYRKWFGEAAQ